MTDGPVISVVVPVLNEARGLPSLLDHLLQLDGRFEVVIADGGSTDGTPQIAAAHPRAPRLVHSPPGRAEQMNAGAAQASGEALLFLHADTRLPPDAYRSLRRALANPGVIGGNFELRFDGADRFSRLLGGWYALQRRAGVYYGDSAIWVRRTAFERLGGYRPLPIMEDYELSRRLQRAGDTSCLPGPAVTSARRWQQLGLLRTIASWVLIRLLFIAGVSPARLARRYPHVREAPLAPGDPLPDLALSETTGHTISLASLTGQEMLMIFLRHLA
ncbi:MAG: TIGR04283 family arsenosugar biosynthesis glycosyltransferase [Solirubrobacteraceae bacterium]